MSHVLLAANVVIERCNSCLNRIYEERRQRLERHVDHLMEEQEKRQRTWWGRLLSEKPITREQMRERVIHQEPIDGWIPSDYCFIKIHGQKGVEVATRLLHAAKISTEVYVDTQDLEWL